MTEPNAPLPGTPSVGLPPRSPEEHRSGAALLQEHPEVPQDDRYSGLELWLRRVSVLVFVFLCAAMGILLIILPWSPRWTDNRLLLAFPGLRTIVANGFTRGLCSGLGVLDVWVGFWEAIHYREEKPGN